MPESISAPVFCAPLELEPAELVLQIARGLEPIGAMERERLEDDPLERLRQLGREVARPRDRAAT